MQGNFFTVRFIELRLAGLRRNPLRGLSRKSWLLLLPLMAIGLTGCGDSVSWNQKLTVVVETPDGEVSGSAVVEVNKFEKGGWWASPHATGVGSKYKGEAAFVRLVEGKYLFVLLDGVDSLAQKHIKSEGGKGALRGEFKNWARFIANSDTVWSLDPLHDHFPMLVTFRDIDDPASVKEVDPADLAATFGPGYALKSVTLEITDEPLTEGQIGSVLSWLREIDGGYLHGGFTSKGAPLGLTGMAFKRER